MTIREAADIIRADVAPSQVAALYGYTPNRGGYICCPFHGEKTASLKLHNSGWYCYGCGVGGSVIDFVMRHEGCSFHDAVKAIDKHMHLGLTDQRASLTASVDHSKRMADVEKVKAQFTKAINAAIFAAEGPLMRWWRIYRDAYATPPQERTGAQWDALHNAREWCLYYEDIQNELRHQLEEVKAWRIGPSNRPSA